MTPEERAEKIVRDIWGYGPGELMPDTENTIGQLAAQIAEAEREAVNSIGQEVRFMQMGEKSYYREGFAAAKAKAVVVARMGRACGCPDPACAGNLIAAQIEGMEP